MSRTLDTIASELRTLATGRSRGDQALHELADKLEDGKRSQVTGIDLATTYSPELMLTDAAPARRRLTNGLELLRDVLIFVPVLYTWWQLARALTAYGDYTGNAPFLLAWQQGFDNRTEPLATSATVVAAIVLGVVFFTLAAHLARSRYELAVHRRRQELSILLGEASQLLAGAEVSSATNLPARAATKISGEILRSSQALQEALAKSSADITSAVNTNPGSNLHEMFRQWTAAAGELTRLGERLQGTQETVTQLRDTQAALSGMASEMAEEIKKLVTALETERELSGQEAHAHRQLAAEVGASTKQLGDSLKGLNERAEQFSELILRLDYVVRRLEPQGGYQ